MSIPITKQTELTQEQFETHIATIEKVFNQTVAKRFSGKTIYYIVDNVFSQPYFVNTIFDDVCEATLHDSFLWIDRSFDINNLQIHGIWKPKKKEFKDILKATPPNTLAYYRAFLCRDNPWSDYGLADGVYPVIQKTEWIKNECNKTFSRETNALPYDTIMGNAISFPVTNRALSKVQPPEMMSSDKNCFDTSFAIQKGISRIFEAFMSWAIIYDWNGIEFIIPMEREYMLNILKNRDKVNGRRPLLPRLVREYERNGTVVARHFSAAMLDKSEPYTMNGKEYKILIGPESYDTYLPGSKKLIRYLKDHRKQKSAPTA